MKQFLFVIALQASGASAFAQAPALADLEVISEKAVTSEELKRLLEAGHNAIVTEGNYPDIITQSNYPNIVTQGNYPDIITNSNYPNIVTQGNYPFAGVDSNSFPEPQLAIQGDK